MADTNATDAVSRRNVLKATGGLLAGATLLAGTGAAQTEEGLSFEEIAVEWEGEIIATKVRVPEEIAESPAFPNRVFLGHSDRFITDGEAVRLREGTDGLATPSEVAETMPALDEDEKVGDMMPEFMMYFRTEEFVRSTGGSVEDEEVTLGLGVFPERTVPEEYFDTARFTPGDFTT